MEGIIEKYVGPVTEWARRKLGPDGDDLAQEVLLNVCMALKSGREIDDVERYIWKTAKYTWCNRLRSMRKVRMTCSINDVVLATDNFADAHADAEAEMQLKAQLRRQIGELMRQERELMVAHYIDGLPVAEAARRAGMTETAAAWKLHEARRKVRDRLMKNIESYSYQPGRLDMGISGDPGPGICDAFQITGNLIRENILLICYGEAHTAEEIAAATGVPMCYIERDIEWLHGTEFLVKTGRKYQTAFPIYDRAHTDKLNAVYASLAGAYAKAIECINAAEGDIRALGFYGDDFAWNRLMWPMLMIFASTAIRNSKTIRTIRERVELPVRTDGGKYQPSGSVRYDDKDVWQGYNGLVSLRCGYGDGPANLLWLGAYNFGYEFPRMCRNIGEAKNTELFDMYVSMTDGTFDKDKLSAYQQDVLAQDIAEGAVTKDMKPDFVVIEADKLEKLRSEIFMPIVQEVIEPALAGIAEDIERYARSRLPAGMKHMADFDAAWDLSEMCNRIIEFAGKRGELYLPADETEGGKLTLMLIK
ncbi:MAG: sigma-70 family RNA polymerase sigma factor [Clostridia bacterium]|nr:sigma-70 family RNA polymerase sigma factor [Clostridia bacterium]